jgi:hypothetical protein
MRSRHLICAVALLLTCTALADAQVSWSGPITDIDGRTGAQYTGPGTSDVRFRRRPWSATEKNLLVENLRIHDVWNQKGIDIGMTRNADGTIWGYENITIRHYEGARINRDESRFPGLHIDFLRIDGGNPQGPGTNVLLEDIWLHDGDALPIIIQDGHFGTVTLRDVLIERTSLNNVQICTINSGSFDRIVIENSPGLRVALMGRPGTIDEVIIRNSPGAVVSDLLVNGGRTGASIIYDNSPLGSKVTAVPEPASLGLIGLGGLLMLRRRTA